MFCVYITFYRGNKMPPFYVGYSRTDRVLLENYHGTVKSKAYKDVWKSELVENPKLFVTKIISKHTTRKEASTKETHIQRKLRVHINPLYINRNISGDTFYRKKNEYKHSEETKKKIGKTNSIRLKGNIPWNKGKSGVYSEKTLQKMREKRKDQIITKESNEKRSAKLKGRTLTPEHVEKVASAQRGKPRKTSGENHPLYGTKRSDETKAKIRESLRKSRESKANV